MGKFSQIAQGAAARRLYTLTLMGGAEVTCAIVPLLSFDELEALAAAQAATKARAATPTDGDPIYELEKRIQVIVRACVDADSPPDAPQPFFDGGVDQIRHPRTGLDRDRILLLYEQWRAHQDDCAPPMANLTPGEYVQQIFAHAAAEAGAELPFESWPRATQRSFVVSMARQLTAVLQLNLLDGSDSPATGESSSTSPRH
ncbi:MAG: hypothetical protein WKG00_03295 [Polyangiaceae bacterium]